MIIMAFTEKVSLSGTALSFLLYECANSINGQEGFLLGDITSEVTNHISDLQSDNARLDIQIVVRNVLPLPEIAHFYMSTGRIKEDVVKEFLSDAANEVVGWYKYRKNNSLKPTMRDKVISRNLQRIFERDHGKRNFVSCGITKKESANGSTHTFQYRFGAVNKGGAYQTIEDVTANLGEKVTGYKKVHRQSPYGVFNKIVKGCNVQTENSCDAILKIQQAVDARLAVEAKTAVKTDMAIRELEAEIQQMTTILSERHGMKMTLAAESRLAEELLERERVLAKVCAEAVANCENSMEDLLQFPEELVQLKRQNSEDNLKDNTKLIKQNIIPTVVDPVIPNYAAALKNKPKIEPTVVNNDLIDTSDDKPDLLMDFETEQDRTPVQKPIILNENSRHKSDSSPEY